MFCTRLARYTLAANDRNALRDDVRSPLRGKKSDNTSRAKHGGGRREAVTRDVDFDDACLLDDERGAFDMNFAEIAVDGMNARDYDDAFFATADDAEYERYEREMGAGASGYREDDLLQIDNGAQQKKKNHRGTTRDDLNLPDQGMDDLMGRVGGEMGNRRASGRIQEFNPFEHNDSQHLPEYDLESDSEDGGLPPLPLDDDDDAAYQPTNASDGTGYGTGTGTGTALNVTHSSVAPSPAMLELEAAAKARAGKQVRPVRKARAARPGTARHRMQTIDQETHLGGDAYRMWLHDNSDTVVAGGRPFPTDRQVDPERAAERLNGSDEKTIREEFFDALFLKGEAGCGLLFRKEARDDVCYSFRNHFVDLFEARKQPWPILINSRAKGGFGENQRQRHPEEELAAEAEALAREAERELSVEQRRERRGRLKHLKRSEALGDLSSDDEGGYKPGPIAMGGEVDKHNLPPMDDSDEDQLPPMNDSDDERPNEDVFRAANRNVNTDGLSLADLLEGCAMDDMRSFSVGVSQQKSGGSQGLSRDFFGSENATSSVGVVVGSASRSKAASGDTSQRVTQYKLKESETPDDQAHGAMFHAARSASVNRVGSAAYNLMQFLSRAVFAAEDDEPAVVSASLQNLCHDNALTKSKAARCFYQTLVLVSGGFLDAKQDLSVPYGEIAIKPGKGFEKGSKRGREEGAEDEEDEDDERYEEEGEEGADDIEVDTDDEDVSEEISEVSEVPEPARRSKRARH